MAVALPPGTPHAGREGAAGLLLSLGGAPVAQPELLSEADWARLSQLLYAHGMAAAAYRPLSHRADCPADVLRRCRAAYLRQLVQNRLLLRQAEELSAALDAAGVRHRWLKGVPALETLYPDPACRCIGDLDVLVSPEQTAAAVSTLERLGYARKSVFPGPEEEAAHAAGSHLAPFHRPESFEVELHLGILGGCGSAENAVAEVWAATAHLSGGEAELPMLPPALFILHACVHYVNHFRLSGAELRWQVDLRLALQRWGAELDWPAFWATAERWGVREETMTCLATARDLWGCPVPGLPYAAAGLAEDAVLESPFRAPGRGLSWLGHRLQTGQRLPPTARVRFWLRLIAPERAFLRERFGGPGGSVAAYGRYVTFALRKVLRSRKC